MEQLPRMLARGIGRIDVDEIESRRCPAATQTAGQVLTDHLEPAGLWRGFNRDAQVLRANGRRLRVPFDRHNGGGSMQQRLAAHDSAATAEVEPATALKTAAEHVHHGFSHPGGGGARASARRTLESASPAEARLAAHGSRGAPALSHSIQRRSSPFPASDDFSGWN